MKEQELADNKKLLKAKDKELAKLHNQQLNNPVDTKNNKSNNGVNLAIGLGIAAVVIGLLCLILLIRKQSRN